MPAIPDSIIGHGSPCAQLLTDLETNNVSHAYLFAGPAHLGKFTVARWFAAQLLLKDIPAEEQDDVRSRIARLTHSDLLVLDQLWMEDTNENWEQISKFSNVPQEHRMKKKAKTDAISIDDVRALLDRLHETAASKYVCCLIRSIERMQDAAANAFLKILEEPPQKVVFLLTTQSLPTLLPTITSRARTLLFHPLAPKELLPLLEDADEEDMGFISHLAQGAPGTVLRLRKNPELLLKEKQLHFAARRFWNETTANRILWLQEFIGPTVDMDNLLLHLGLTLREVPLAERQPAWHDAYHSLLRGAQTNAHRGLLLQEFALATG